VPILEYDGKQVAVDEDGFLVRFEEWNDGIARKMAEKEGISTLHEDQIDILKFMRDYYRRHNFFPIIRYVCNISINRKIVSTRNLSIRCMHGK